MNSRKKQQKNAKIFHVVWIVSHKTEGMENAFFDSKAIPSS